MLNGLGPKNRALKTAARCALTAPFIEANIHHPTRFKPFERFGQGDLPQASKKSGPAKLIPFQGPAQGGQEAGFQDQLHQKTPSIEKSLYRKLIRHCQDLYGEALQIVMRLDGRAAGPLAQKPHRLS